MNIDKFLEASGDMKDFSSHLAQLHTHLFTYMKNTHDGTQIYLSSDPQWVEDYYRLKLYESSYFEDLPKNYQTGFQWWPGSSDLPIYTHARDNFKSYHGITYCNQTTDGCEFFFFSSDQNQATIHNIYLNNLDLLKKFTEHFKDKAGNLLKEAKQHSIIRAPHLAASEYENITVDRDAFLKSINMNASSLSIIDIESLNIKFSTREKELIRYLVTGKSIKCIAAEMGISPRTAESYYENIKSKTGVYSKAELIALFICSSP